MVLNFSDLLIKSVFNNTLKTVLKLVMPLELGHDQPQVLTKQCKINSSKSIVWSG